MLSREDRRARQARLRKADPDNRWQRIGYDYLTDEHGIRLERIEAGREYDEAIGGGQWGAVTPPAPFEERGELRGRWRP